MTNFHLTGFSPNRSEGLYDVGSVLLSRFTILREVAAGGEGAVYQARDLLTGRLVALKITHTSDDWRTSQLRRVAHLLSRLNHPNIVRHVDCLQLPDGRLTLVTEWLEGDSLESVSNAGWRPTLRQLLLLGLHLADALHAVHCEGVLHCDVKPLNLIVPIGEDGPRCDDVSLMDFGIFRKIQNQMVASSHIRSCTITGSPGFMAPEQMTGRAVSPATDLYALGATLYVLWFKRLPWATDQYRRVRVVPDVPRLILGPLLLRKVTEDVILPPEPSLPPRAVSILERMLRRRVDERPQEARAVSAELASLITEFT